MFESNGTRNRHALQPTNGLTRRCFPALQAEIGEDEADLLLQIDHWIAYEGNAGWIEISARTIKDRAFPTWHIRKIQRLIVTLAERGFIQLANSTITKTKEPMIALCFEKLATLKSINVIYNFFGYVTIVSVSMQVIQCLPGSRSPVFPHTELDAHPLPPCTKELTSRGVHCACLKVCGKPVSRLPRRLDNALAARFAPWPDPLRRLQSCSPENRRLFVTGITMFFEKTGSDFCQIS